MLQMNYHRINEDKSSTQINPPILAYHSPNNSQQIYQQQQPIIVIPTIKPSKTANRNINDDPSCLHIASCLGFFIPIIGLLMLCLHSCGTDLPPKQAHAFKILVACTVAGMITNTIIYSMSS
eukprot:277912_1